MQETTILTIGDILIIFVAAILVAVGITLLLVPKTIRISQSELRQRLWEEGMFLLFLLKYSWRKIAGFVLILFSIWILLQSNLIAY